MAWTSHNVSLIRHIVSISSLAFAFSLKRGVFMHHSRCWCSVIKCCYINFTVHKSGIFFIATFSGFSQASEASVLLCERAPPPACISDRGYCRSFLLSGFSSHSLTELTKFLQFDQIKPYISCFFAQIFLAQICVNYKMFCSLCLTLCEGGKKITFCSNARFLKIFHRGSMSIANV